MDLIQSVNLKQFQFIKAEEKTQNASLFINMFRRAVLDRDIQS